MFVTWTDGSSLDYLAHHGIKGQKWGIRNYQYEDGTLTPQGREHYRRGFKKSAEDKLLNYKIREHELLDTRYNNMLRSQYKKEVQARQKKIGLNEKSVRYKKLSDKEKYAKLKSDALSFLKDIEHTVVSELTSDQMKAEKITIGKAFAADMAVAAASAGLAIAGKVPIVVIPVPDTGRIKTSMRLGYGDEAHDMVKMLKEAGYKDKEIEQITGKRVKNYL